MLYNLLKKISFFNNLDPYMRLMRVDRPIGFWLLLWPCLWSIVMAADTLSDAWFFIIMFTIGAFLMRGAGCAVNDIIDRDFDKNVARTQNRPLASGELSVKQAKRLVVFLIIPSFFILLSFNIFTIILGFVSLGLVGAYPLMKRFINLPQLFLGLTFNWGVLMGWAAVQNDLTLATFILYIGCIFWTLGYDTIYAQQDIEDDKNIGIKSSALFFKGSTKQTIERFYNIAAVLIAIAALLSGSGIIFFAIGAVGGWQLYWQTNKFSEEDNSNCDKLFKSNCYFGLIIFVALVIDKLY